MRSVAFHSYPKKQTRMHSSRMRTARFSGYLRGVLGGVQLPPCKHTPVYAPCTHTSQSIPHPHTHSLSMHSSQVHAGIHTPLPKCILGYRHPCPNTYWYTHIPCPSTCWDTDTPAQVHTGIQTPLPKCMLGYTPFSCEQNDRQL